jgi:hypothetical protein
MLAQAGQPGTTPHHMNYNAIHHQIADNSTAGKRLDNNHYFNVFNHYMYLAETIKGLNFAREAHLGWSVMSQAQRDHVMRMCSNNSTDSVVSYLRSGAVDCIPAF